jgi:hypothetical protein
MSHSLLSLLVTALRPRLDTVPDVNQVDCFYGNPLSVLGERAPKFGRGQLGNAMGQGFSWHWLATKSHAPLDRRDTFMWLSTLVDRRTFAWWCLMEFAAFLRDPRDPAREARLLGVASRDAGATAELSMNFVKATWLGYHELVSEVANLISPGGHTAPFSRPGLELHWIDAHDNTTLRPLTEWPFDQSEWTAFVQKNGHRPLRLSAGPLRVRQLLALARPSRVAGAKNLGARFGASFINPTMPALRLLKDGFKGTSRTPSALGQLVAAASVDKRLADMTTTLPSAQPSHEQGATMPGTSKPPALGFEQLVERWRSLRAQSLPTNFGTRFAPSDGLVLCRLRCRLDAERPGHFIAAGDVERWLPSDGRGLPVLVAADCECLSAEPQPAVAYEVTERAGGMVGVSIELYAGSGTGFESLWLSGIDPLDVDVQCFALNVATSDSVVLALVLQIRC